MTSGVVGMRSLMPTMSRQNTFGLNGITGDQNRLAFGVEDIKNYAIQLLDQLEALMTNDMSDHKSSHKLIAKVCQYLKSEGSRLDDDSTFKQQLDVYFDLLRNILRKPKLSPLARTMILEVIELRASYWSINEDLVDYYQRKLTEFDANESNTDMNTELQKSQSFVSNQIGSDLLKSSAKVNKQTKVSGKTFLRDEVLIRNGDSGKVMGIKGRRVHLIEEMSDTVISFQKVTVGAKERLVQITGPSEESIEKAKELIETTIKRNASPVPFECPNKAFDLNYRQSSAEMTTTVVPVMESTPIERSESTNAATIESKMSHTFTVTVNNDVIQLSTTNYDLGLRAQNLLETLLLECPLKTTQHNLKEADTQTTTSYEKLNSISPESNDFDFKDKVVPKTDPKSDIMAALDSVTKVVPTEPKVNSIRRSLSQGTVPTGRTSLRFMSKSVGHEDSTPKITYERHFLMSCSQLPSSKSIPNVEVMAKIYKKTPEIIRKQQTLAEKIAEKNSLLKSQSFTQSRTISVENWE